MKRFTETTKWEKVWFRKLPPEYKCFWYYLTEHCDVAGVWEVDLELVHTFIGKKVELNVALNLFNNGKKRVIVLENGDWYLPDYIPFQCGELSITCPAHKPVFKLLQKHNLPNRVSNTLLNTLHEKEKDTEKDKENETEQEKENHNEQIKKIYDFYKILFDRPKYQLTEKRRKKVQSRLLEPAIGVVHWANNRFLELLVAITEVSLTDFNMGKNDQQKTYIELDEHCCRNQEQVEQRLNQAVERSNLETIKRYLTKEGYLNENITS